MEEARPINVGDKDFEDEVLKSNIPVVVDFWAPWCGPCQIAGPVLEKIAQEYAGKAKVCKVNVDEARQTAMEYGIMAIPTLNIYKGGKVMDQIVGVVPGYESNLRDKIEKYIEDQGG